MRTVDDFIWKQFYFFPLSSFLIFLGTNISSFYAYFRKSLAKFMSTIPVIWTVWSWVYQMHPLNAQHVDQQIQETVKVASAKRKYYDPLKLFYLYN